MSDVSTQDIPVLTFTVEDTRESDSAERFDSRPAKRGTKPASQMN